MANQFVIVRGDRNFNSVMVGICDAHTMGHVSNFFLLDNLDYQGTLEEFHQEMQEQTGAFRDKGIHALKYKSAARAVKGIEYLQSKYPNVADYKIVYRTRFLINSSSKIECAQCTFPLTSFMDYCFRHEICPKCGNTKFLDIPLHQVPLYPIDLLDKYHPSPYPEIKDKVLQIIDSCTMWGGDTEVAEDHIKRIIKETEEAYGFYKFGGVGGVC